MLSGQVSQLTQKEEDSVFCPLMLPVSGWESHTFSHVIVIVSEGRVWGVGLERVVVVVVGTQKQEECYILYSLTDLLWILISVLVCSQAASNKGS